MLNMGYKTTEFGSYNLSGLISHLVPCFWQTDFLLLHQSFCSCSVIPYAGILSSTLSPTYPFMSFKLHPKGNSLYQNTLDPILYTSADYTFLSQMSSQLFFMYAFYCLMNVYRLSSTLNSLRDQIILILFYCCALKPNTLPSNEYTSIYLLCK